MMTVPAMMPATVMRTAPMMVAMPTHLGGDEPGIVLDLRGGAWIDQRQGLRSFRRRGNREKTETKRQAQLVRLLMEDFDPFD